MEKIFSTDISKDQAKDTGMAIVLILLIFAGFLEQFLYVKIAILILLLDMIYPMLFKYFAVVWFGFSRLLGMVVSKVILTVIFYFVVTPIGLIRRILGYDSLKLKQYKVSTESVMIERDIEFSKEDIEKPF